MPSCRFKQKTMKIMTNVCMTHSGWHTIISRSTSQRESISFTFDFLREDKHLGKFIEASLRLRVEVQKQVVLMGLSQDF